MNRIKLSPLANTKKTDPNTEGLFPFEKQPPRYDQETSLFMPLHYEKNYAYPLVIWLHSDGQTPAELQTVMARLSMRNYVGVAPQAPVGNFQCGYFWEQDYDAVSSSLESVLDAIEHATTRLNINSSRIFIGGENGGGTMALRLAMMQPKTFAGAISLNGPIPTGMAPFSNWARCRNMPVFWSHSMDQLNDSNGDELQSNDFLKQFQFLYSAGFLNLSAREYPTQDSLQELAPRAINQWMMEQIESAII